MELEFFVLILQIGTSGASFTGLVKNVLEPGTKKLLEKNNA